MSDALLTRIAVALEALVAIKSGKATGKPATTGTTQAPATATQPAAAATGKPAAAPPKATPAAGTKPATPTKPAAAAPKPAAAAPKPAAAAPKPAATTTTTAPTEPADDTKAPDGKNTYRDVVNALKAVKHAQNKEAAMTIMREAGGGAGAVRDLKPIFYDAVVAAATQVIHPPKATSAGTVVVSDELGDAVDTSGASAATAGEDEPPEGGSGEDL